MASIDSLSTLLVNERRDIYDAEQRLTKAIPKLAEAASNPELIQALNTHLNETLGHVMRVEQAFTALSEDAKTEHARG